jgi:hypothetical protein
MLELT